MYVTELCVCLCVMELVVTVVCGRVVCDKVVCERVVCERVVCERVVCDKVVCDRAVSEKSWCGKVVWRWVRELCVCVCETSE